MQSSGIVALPMAQYDVQVDECLLLCEVASDGVKTPVPLLVQSNDILEILVFSLSEAASGTDMVAIGTHLLLLCLSITITTAIKIATTRFGSGIVLLLVCVDMLD